MYCDGTCGDFTAEEVRDGVNRMNRMVDSDNVGSELIAWYGSDKAHCGGKANRGPKMKEKLFCHMKLRIGISSNDTPPSSSKVVKTALMSLDIPTPLSLSLLNRNNSKLRQSLTCSTMLSWAIIIVESSSERRILSLARILLLS